MRMSIVSRRSVLVAGAAAAAVAAVAVSTGRSGKAAPGGGTAKTLVRYDTTGDYGWLGEVYATQTANLSSHFGSWTAAPVSGFVSADSMLNG